jgi:peptide deformylase
VPGIYDEVERAQRIRVRAQDRHVVVFERDLEGIRAVCLQHEMDHLEGKLFVDYLSSLKRDRIRRKLEKERRDRAPAGRAPAGAAQSR